MSEIEKILSQVKTDKLLNARKLVIKVTGISEKEIYQFRLLINFLMLYAADSAYDEDALQKVGKKILNHTYDSKVDAVEAFIRLGQKPLNPAFLLESQNLNDSNKPDSKKVKNKYREIVRPNPTKKPIEIPSTTSTPKQMTTPPIKHHERIETPKDDNLWSLELLYNLPHRDQPYRSPVGPFPFEMDSTHPPFNPSFSNNTPGIVNANSDGLRVGAGIGGSVIGLLAIGLGVACYKYLTRPRSSDSLNIDMELGERPKTAPPKPPRNLFKERPDQEQERMLLQFNTEKL